MAWNNLTRLTEDICALKLKEQQSSKSGDYRISTPGYRWCESAKNYSLLMSEPAHYYKVYNNSCVVDTGTTLRNAEVTNPRYKHQLFARPYAGSYMGAGQNTAENKDTETQLIYGLDTRGGPRKACDVLSGVSIDRFECLPEYGNPQRVEHIVPQWIRGGDNTRDYVRRVNYEKHQLNKRNNKAIYNINNNNNPSAPYMH